MGQFPYKAHFNEIAEEERDHGYPDITFIVRSTDGYPRQIDFGEVSDGTPNPEQLKSLKKGTAEIIELYCPANRRAQITHKRRWKIHRLGRKVIDLRAINWLSYRRLRFSGYCKS
jgi:hypothetical protein